MFDHAPFGLRFELGGDLPMGPLRFMQALDRARSVARALFSGSETLIAVVSINGEDCLTKRQSTSIQQLKRIGFPHRFELASKVAQNDQDHIAEFGRDMVRHCHVAEFANDEASVFALLWASVGREMDVQPKARWLDTIHLADIKKKLALTAYDDRGMDVVGPDARELSSLYRTFNPWLLDHDRAVMDTKFSL
ncbi:DUF3885 domain-containing protein [Fulvimarina sp. MAC3]|uniref:DUF3885 domain-containing protein n=1 Tax=Fulvimarina sp. MAC3 TaxID=3148887 RepID=UPI0031FD5F0D